MRRLPRWMRSGWGISLLLAAAIFCLLTVVPVMPWRARCYEEPVPGPYRPIFVQQVSAWLAHDGVYHWRISNVILLRVLPLFDGKGVFSRENTLVNIGKISGRLEHDVTIDGVLYPKPPALLQVEEEQRERGAYDGFERCRAAIQRSPADPPVRQAPSQL